MDNKISIEPRRQQRRRNRDADNRSTSTDERNRRTGHSSQSPPHNSRVVILAKNPNQKSNTPTAVSILTSGSQSTAVTPVPTIQIMSSLHSQQQHQNVNTSNTSNANASNTGHMSSVTKSAQSVGAFSTQSAADDAVNELMAAMPSVMTLIDSESLMFLESPANDFLLSDAMTASGFSVISTVGMDGVGKSSVLNLIAGRDVFRVHSNKYSERPLKHKTKGVKLHITKERLLLLDSQPLLSASVLDEYLQKCPPLSSTGVDISEPENYSFMISLQLLSFLFATTDYLIIVMDWVLDIHLIKLMATAIMMVGETTQKADIIIFFRNSETKMVDKKTTNVINSLLGRSVYVTVISGDEKELLNAVMKAPAKRNPSENGRNSSHASEKSWLLSSQRYWETSIRKSSLYSDYGRFLP
ncbi:unnamed protein product [Medioppia subpectinata]|uniref:Uncharacterized protein n=1 Tax=Medioppia subpectinata TaxID=1979941 RepID=A0A7R9KHQ3_9ACAR|nr:unnamed protein product [Medioppia subpectinata]CAG2103582.1 unnamed protein product [Medioppia subpectinata]